MSSLATYLAKNYLTASTPSTSESTRPRKRRKKDKSSNLTSSGLTIAEDDGDLALSGTKDRSKGDGLDDEDIPVFENSARSAEFRRATKNNWKTISAGSAIAPTPPPPEDADQAVADRILAEAADDNDTRMREVETEDGPTIVDGVQQEGANMGSMPATQSSKPGRPGGLQTAEDTARLEAAATARRAAESRSSKKPASKAEETVYRDATGRRIDISMRRAEVREAAEEQRRQEKRDKEAAMGDVQRREKEERKQALEEAKFLGVARHADDESLNDEMRGVSRWGDPMLGYVRDQDQDKGGKEEAPGFASGNMVAATPSSRKKREYQGAGAPNRYGIRPGWRWDGVDRGNGFEKEWFQARSRKSRNEHLEYQWQMDE